MLSESQGYETNEVTTFFFGVLPLYGLFILIGFLAASSWAYIEWNKKGYHTFDFLYMASFVSIFALYGAKIWYIIFSPVEAFQGVNDFLDVITILLIPAFGRSILGTVVATPIGIIIWQKYWGSQYKKLELIDIVMPAMLIGQAIGRFGNLFDHNVYGGIVTEEQISWLPNFIVNNMYICGNYRQPLFLYESILDMLAFVLLIIIFKTNNYFEDGVAGSSYFLSYGTIRACLEPFRDEQFKMSWGDFPTSTIVSILILLLGLLGIIYFQFFKKNNKKI